MEIRWRVLYKFNRKFFISLDILSYVKDKKLITKSLGSTKIYVSKRATADLLFEFKATSGSNFNDTHLVKFSRIYCKLYFITGNIV